MNGSVMINVTYHSLEMAKQQILMESTLKKARKRYNREEKLKVVKYYHMKWQEIVSNMKEILDELQVSDA